MVEQFRDVSLEHKPTVSHLEGVIDQRKAAVHGTWNNYANFSPTSRTGILPDFKPTVIWKFGDALGELKHGFSIHEAPTRWLKANANGIWEAVNNLQNLDISKDELSGSHKLIYPVSDFVAFGYQKAKRRISGSQPTR